MFFSGQMGLLTVATVSQMSEAAVGSTDLGHLMTRLVLQLAIIMIAARLGGIVVQRWLRGPKVLGELVAGMIIGPYALGAASLPGWGPLFPLSGGALPVSPELYGIATIASITLLFLSGLETDLTTLLHYSIAAIVIGLGGLVVSFVLGDLCAVWFGFGESFLDPPALFMGTIATATSVGITARVLSEKRKMSSPEGVTILAAAVLDDVLGIVVLALVIGMAKAKASGGALDWGSIGFLAFKAIGFWIVFMVGGLLLSRRLTRVLKLLRSTETIAAICFGLALLVAGLSEMAGLAMIIGAYIMGLSLSNTDLVDELQTQLRGLYNFLIPVFFCVMGMLVDFRTMGGVLVFGFVYAVLAILAKIIGCGVPAWFMKFSVRGALRIGAGMVPRAEVALIIAGIGLSIGIIGPDVFGVAIMMSMLSTITAPPLLVKAFESGPGLRGEGRVLKERMVSAVIELPAVGLSEFLCSRITEAFRVEEFFVNRLHTDVPTWQIRKEDMVFTVMQEGSEIVLMMPVQHQYVARLIVLEELLALQDLLDTVKDMKSPDLMGSGLLTGAFDK